MERVTEFALSTAMRTAFSPREGKNRPQPRQGLRGRPKIPRDSHLRPGGSSLHRPGGALLEISGAIIRAVPGANVPYTTPRRDKVASSAGDRPRTPQ